MKRRSQRPEVADEKNASLGDAVQLGLGVHQDQGRASWLAPFAGGMPFDRLVLLEGYEAANRELEAIPISWTMFKDAEPVRALPAQFIARPIAHALQRIYYPIGRKKLPVGAQDVRRVGARRSRTARRPGRGRSVRRRRARLAARTRGGEGPPPPPEPPASASRSCVAAGRDADRVGGGAHHVGA